MVRFGISISFLWFSVLAIVSCGIQRPMMGDGSLGIDKSNHTGGSLKIAKSTLSGQSISEQVPYVISGSPELFDKVRSEISNYTDKELANYVDRAFLLRTNSTLQVTIYFFSNQIVPGGKLVFDGSLKPSKNGEEIAIRLVPHVGHAISNTDFLLDVTCFHKCKIADLRLSRSEANSSNKSKRLITGIIYRSTDFESEIRMSDKQKNQPQSNFNRVVNEISDPTKILTVTSIVDGPSRAIIASNVSPDNRIHRIELVSTDMGTTEIPNNEKDGIKEELVGINPVDGSFVVRYSDSKGSLNNADGNSGENDSENEAIIVIKPRLPKEPHSLQSSNQPAGQNNTVSAKDRFNDGINSQSPKRGNNEIFPLPLVTGPRTNEVIRHFEVYRNNIYVKKMIDLFLEKSKQNDFYCMKNIRDKKTGKSKLQKIYPIQPSLSKTELFATYMPPVAQKLSLVTTAEDIPPDIAYILMLESNYGKNDKYNTQVYSGVDHSSLGPWQINDATAREIKNRYKKDFFIHPVDESRRPNKNDDRIYFLNATYLATLRMDQLLDMHPKDPAMAILGYNAGPAGSRSALDMYGLLSFDELLRYNIGTKNIEKYCPSVIYTIAFLAARAIGQNLDEYGLGPYAVTTSKNYQKFLKRKGGPLPEGI